MGTRRGAADQIAGLSRANAQAAMLRAIRLATGGTGSTYPNPCVGAVLVSRSGAIVASARSGATGEAHAEVRALRRAGPRARGAVLFVSLEPCAHFGRTPPCTQAIVDAQVAAVVIGVRDDAPHVDGRGIAALRRAGIHVSVGLCGPAAARAHAHYLHHVRTRLPWVTLKAAVSIDGQLACASGHSQWITGEAARRDAHRQRALHHAVLVGRATVEADDPELNVRLCRGVDPQIVVLDSRLRLASRNAKVLRAGTWVVHGPQVNSLAVRRLRAKGVELVEVAAQADGRVDVSALLHMLGTRSIRSVLVEGGGAVLSSFYARSSWQQFRIYQAPRLLGGHAQAMLPGLGWARVDDAPVVQVVQRRRLGDDLLTVLSPVS